MNKLKHLIIVALIAMLSLLAFVISCDKYLFV